MGTFTVHYKIESKNHIDTFELEFDDQSILLLPGSQPDPLPAWTDLTFHQCSNCPLKADTDPKCPVAVNLVPVVNDFARIYSYETAHITVTTAERTIAKQANIESALGSLMGLIMATSGCPHFTFFRPMARFHLPFANPVETIFRATSTYLLARYIEQKQGDSARFELDGLIDIYQQIQIVNRAFVDRLRAACDADGTLNALVLLDLFAQHLPAAIDGMLQEVSYLFEPFLNAPSA